MSDFLNRIKAQSDMLKVVNSLSLSEELYGLSSGAIERWVKENMLDNSSVIVGLVRETADKLFFLANKSQEQITEDYRTISSEVSLLITKAKEEVERLRG